MIIAIDFDGTCVTHEFPRVGKDIGAVPVLKELIENGCQFILNTMRSDNRGSEHNMHPLSDAVNWFYRNDIPLYGINTNPTQKEWTGSPKAYVQLYIDDAALGCPLVYPADGRPFVDWMQVAEWLRVQGIIKRKEQ